MLSTEGDAERPFASTRIDDPMWPGAVVGEIRYRGTRLKPVARDVAGAERHVG